MSNDENWLHSAFIHCLQCHERLYRLDHSPMCDDYLLYCDHCANAVEVGYYDPIHQAIFEDLRQKGEHHYYALMAAIEERLHPCDCGGHYAHSALRRCYRCLAPVLIDTPGVDLWPDVYGLDVDERDPTQEETEFVEWFEEQYIRRSNIWK